MDGVRFVLVLLLVLVLEIEIEIEIENEDEDEDEDEDELGRQNSVPPYFRTKVLEMPRRPHSSKNPRSCPSPQSHDAPPPARLALARCDAG